MIVKYLLSAIIKWDYLLDLPINETKESQINFERQQKMFSHHGLNRYKHHIIFPDRTSFYNSAFYSTVQ
jgi:hypothetical protein